MPDCCKKFWKQKREWECDETSISPSLPTAAYPSKASLKTQIYTYEYIKLFEVDNT